MCALVSSTYNYQVAYYVPQPTSTQTIIVFLSVFLPVTCTSQIQLQAWWQVDLQGRYDVVAVGIFRKDGTSMLDHFPPNKHDIMIFFDNNCPGELMMV